VKSTAGALSAFDLVTRAMRGDMAASPEQFAISEPALPHAANARLEVGNRVRLRALYCPGCGRHRSAWTDVDAEWPASILHVPCAACAPS
jgi:hypothetical protein